MSAVSDGEAEQGSRDAEERAAQSRSTLTVPRRLLRLRSDAALAERYAAGDEGAFNVLYERHRGAVLAVCMGVLGTRHDAEDATQEAFSSLTTTLRAAGEPPREVRAWLLRVARNASIDAIRRRRHRLLTIDGEIPDIQARQPTGESELEIVMEGVRELPENQRLALMMRELGGHSYKDIAQLLDTDEDGVRGLIARARVALRSYREAIEMPCAVARAAIAAEPDGRRREKTVRHHLKHCEACRDYLGALRDDARLLRAAIPGQAATVIAGGGTSGGSAVAAAKSVLLGAGLTQAATACAASVCAVGAVGMTVGGIVLLAPAHHVTSETLTPAATTATEPPRHVPAAGDADRHRTATTAVVTPAPATAPPTSTLAAHSVAATVGHGEAAAPVEPRRTTRRRGHGDGQRANAVDGTYPFTTGSSHGGGHTVGKPTFSEPTRSSGAPKSGAVVTTTPAAAPPPTGPTPVTVTAPTPAGGTGHSTVPSTETTPSTVVATGAPAPADTGSSAADSAGSSRAADPSSSGSTPTGASDPSGATGSGSGGTTSGAAAAGGTVSSAPSSGGAGRGGSAATGTDPTAVTSTSPETSPTSTTAAVTATTAGTDTTASTPTSTDVTPAPTRASAPAWYGPSSPRWQRDR